MRSSKRKERHLQEVVAAGDETHKRALKSMKGSGDIPLPAMGWYKDTKRDFAALPED